jgi:hypothetical protein
MKIIKKKTENLCITACSFNCRVIAGISVSAFNKLLCNLTGKCLEIGN